MAPFDYPYSSSLENKISTQIEGQLPDFIISEHPLFVKFLKYYYEYLEAGELTLTATIDNIAQETVSSNYILDEKGEKIVTETGAGTLGKFTVGETITGATSKATAKVLVDDLANKRLFITSKTQFITGEQIDGGTSSATGIVTRYRANPIQTIQQLLSYADTDNTIYDFLDQLRDSFMAAIPTDLASGINKRNLIKNIRELYRAKGTADGHKIFMRMLLDEDSEIFYPNKYMLKPSSGDWVYKSKMRCTLGTNSISSEVVGRTLTGQTWGATVQIVDATEFNEGADTVVEFEIDIGTLDGTFVDGETVTAVSKVQDVSMSFVIKGLVASTSLSNDGILYSKNDEIELDTNTGIGNALAAVKVDNIKAGTVDGIAVDDVGTKYRVGDPLVFTSTEDDVTSSAGFISIIDGSLVLDGTDVATTNAGDYIVLEDGSFEHLEFYEVELEDNTIGTEPYAVYGTDISYSTTKGYYYPLYLDEEQAFASTITKASAKAFGTTTSSTALVLDENVGTIAANMIIEGTGIDPSTTVTVKTVTDQNNIILSSAQSITDNVVLSFKTVATKLHIHKFLEFPNKTFYMPTENSNHYKDTYDSAVYNLFGINLVLDATGPSSENTNYKISMHPFINQVTADTYGSGSDRLVLEEGHFSVNEEGTISKTFVSNGGSGYTLLPTVAISSSLGTGGKVLATTKSIGAVDSINLTNEGFKYTEAPALTFRANLVLKDVSGTFVVGNTLTTHTGTVKAWDSSTQVLETTLEDVVRIALDTADKETIELEDSLKVFSDVKDTTVGLVATVDTEDQIVDESGNRIVLDADSTLNGYIILEAGNGETAGSALVIEAENESYFPPVRLEHATSGGDVGQHLLGEGGTGNLILTETSYSRGASSIQLQRFLTEDSQLITARQGGEFDTLITNGFIDDEDNSTLVLDGTDSSQTNAGGDILNEEHGNNNTIILDGTDSDGTDVNAKLLQDSDTTSGSIAIDGTNSSSLNVGDSIVHEVTGIDFSAGTTVITDSDGATGTIVNADVAKGATTNDITTTTLGGYGIVIENLIGEDLIRLQDSYYYQQFSYEVQTPASGNDYIRELKRSVHPTGFNVFAKVNIATSISVAIGLVGSSLGAGYTSDTDTYSPILASTFEIIFGETLQRRLKSVEIPIGDYEEQIILEESEDESAFEDSIILDGTDSSSTHAGSYLISETPVYAFPDFDGIAITHNNLGDDPGDSLLLDGTDSSSSNTGDNLVLNGTNSGSTNAGEKILSESTATVRTGAGDFGTLLLNGTDSSSSNSGDKIVSESAELITNNLVMDSIEHSNHLVPDGDGDDLLLNGTDSSYTDTGYSIELEDAISDGSNIRIGINVNRNRPTVLNEDGGTQQLETSVKGQGPNHDLSLVSYVTRKVNIPQPTPRHLSTGLITLAKYPFQYHGVVEVERGTAVAGKLLLNGAEIELDAKPTAVTYAGENFQLEDATEVNLGASLTFEDIESYRQDNIVLDGTDFYVVTIEDGGTDGGGTNADDTIILDGTDSSSTNAGGSVVMNITKVDEGSDILLDNSGVLTTGHGERLIGENLHLATMTLSDILRPDLLLMSSGPDFGPMGGGGSSSGGAIEPVGILLEASQDNGAFRQEDETTVTGTLGDDILLEDKTGVGFNNKLLIEFTRVELELSINTGTIPFQNWTNSKIIPATRPAEIFVSDIGQLHLEDEAAAATNIRLEGNSDATGILIMNGIDVGSTLGGNPLRLEAGEDIQVNYGTGSIVLNGTDGSSTNAGGEIDAELGTADDIMNNYGIVIPTRWDSGVVTFDNVLLTFDSTE